MPIRAYCTICSDYFDNVRDVAAIHCGHTFHLECLNKWFYSAPNRTCPQCRIQLFVEVNQDSFPEWSSLFSAFTEMETCPFDMDTFRCLLAQMAYTEEVSSKHIIQKLFFDSGGELEAPLDAESLKNELDKTKAQLTAKGPTVRQYGVIHKGWTIQINPTFFLFEEMLQCGIRESWKSAATNSLNSRGAKAQICLNPLNVVKFIEKEKRDCQSIVDMLRETLDVRNATVESLQKELVDTEMLCSTLKKQMKFLEKQQDETKAAKEEARRLRIKMKSMESLELLLSGQRLEVEEMVRDMGIGQSAVEQLAVYCVSLKKEYEKLKEVRKASSEMTEKLKRELFSTSNTLQKTLTDLDKTKEELQSTQKELRGADKEILSLKKKVELLQKTLSAPNETNEAISRLVFESPAPLELHRPRLHRPADGEEIDLDMTFDVETPDHLPPKPIIAPTKKIKLDPIGNTLKSYSNNILQQSSRTKQHQEAGQEEADDEVLLPAFIKNSLLKTKPHGSLLDPHRNNCAIRTGYDGMGGRTKFIQPTNLMEIRPLVFKKKKVSRTIANPVSKDSVQPTMDIYLK